MRFIVAAAAIMLLAACGSTTVPTQAPPTPAAPTPPPVPPTPPPPPSPYFNGRYVLTFAADSACTALPADVRKRTYTGTVGDAYGSYRLTLAGARFYDAGQGPFNVMWSRVVDDFVSLFFDDGPVVELLADDSYVSIYGGAEGPITTDSPSELTMWAQFTYCESRKPGTRYPECSAPSITCSSNRHRLTLARP